MVTFPTARPDLEWSTPLSLPLEFHLEDARLKREGEARLAGGDYTAIRLVKYTQKTTCDGCGRIRQAQQCVVIKERDTGEELHIGMSCLRRLYRTQADAVQKHAAQVRGTLRTLLARLKLRDVPSVEVAIERVTDLATKYLPHAAPYLQQLRTMDTLTPGKTEQDLLVRVRGLTLYHQEWQDDPERARRRWRALRFHPMLRELSERERRRVHDRCDRALASGTRLPDDEVHALNQWLARAERWDPPFTPLVRPEAFADEATYMQALETALHVAVASGELDQVYWRPPFLTHPTEVVGARVKRAHAVVALEPSLAGPFRTLIMNEDTYRSGSRSVIVKWGQEGQFEQAAQYRQRGGTDDEGSDVVRAGWTFRYRTLGWTLVESYTATHTAWHAHGRAYLEAYL